MSVTLWAVVLLAVLQRMAARNQEDLFRKTVVLVRQVKEIASFVRKQAEKDVALTQRGYIVWDFTHAKSGFFLMTYKRHGHSFMCRFRPGQWDHVTLATVMWIDNEGLPFDRLDADRIYDAVQAKKKVS